MLRLSLPGPINQRILFWIFCTEGTTITLQQARLYRFDAPFQHKSRWRESRPSVNLAC
jgi:hypothetical protein